MRAALITTGSVLLTAAVIGNAFYHKKQFYPSVVYITKSNSSMAVVYVQCLVVFLLVGKLMRKIFFGTLRAAELEHLIERAWYAVTETCLAFTVFRDDLNARFVGIFAVLLFLKCFHWMAEDRVDFMERSPNINILFHIRIVSLLTVLAIFDFAFIYFAYHSTVTKGAGTQMVFGFEYAILLAAILNIVMKYLLHWIDIASDSPWEEKAVWLLYTELVMSLIKVSLYSIFVGAMLRYHNFPLFALRPIYLSLRTLKKALCDVIMSRRAIRNMNTLYPDATQEELANTDNVCIICREEMTGNGTSKKLPCNHIFHVTCLRSWFQRQQTCPTCRMDILRLPNTNSTANNNNNNNNININNNNNNNIVNNNLNNNQARNNFSVRSQQAPPAMAGALNPPVAAATGPGNPIMSQASIILGQTIGPGGVATQPQVILQDQVAIVMVQTFAQMFVEAMIAHLQTLNSNQYQQQQQTQPTQQTQTSPQQTQTSQQQTQTSQQQTQTSPQQTRETQTPNEQRESQQSVRLGVDASTQTQNESEI